MKIAYVLSEYPSLSETFIAREIEALRRRGFEIDVWALKAGEGAQLIAELSTAQCLMKPLRRFSSSARGKYFRHLGKHWAETEAATRKNALADVQHIHAGWSSFPADIAREAAGVLGVPWSFSAHARDLWVENEGLAEKLQTAKFAACCTREGAKYLKSLSPNLASRVLYAPHGIEISNYEFRARSELQAPIRILAVGRLVEKKGFSVLLEAMKDNDFHLEIIGEGPEKNALEKICAQGNLQNRVAFLGGKTHAQVIAAMQESDLFAMPSTPARDGDRDGLPNVLLEAAACGLPMVATQAGAIENFLDENCAWLCASGDAGALADTIHNAIENYDESLRRARNARSRVEANFDVDKNIEVLARAFDGENL